MINYKAKFYHAKDGSVEEIRKMRTSMYNNLFKNATWAEITNYFNGSSNKKK